MSSATCARTSSGSVTSTPRATRGVSDLDDAQELNYRGICQAIAATGYDLYVGHEFKPKGDPIEALRAAFAECDQEG